ncbi:MAG TPA: glycosyltransferase family 4 protein [Phycisphaerae bacterium]|nr:glycosyltransferase family 4 protein [Phycisphaerae bacterium]
MSRRILFVSEGAETSPTRYRALAYFELLRQAGWTPEHVTVVGLWRRVLLVQAAWRADVIVVLRKAFSPGLCRALRRGGGRGRGRRRLVYDIDDALFAGDDGRADARVARRFARMAAAVDEVWAGNEYLAYEAARHTAVRVLPTAVEMRRYALGVKPAAAEGERRLDVVWIGSSSTRKYLEEAVPWLAEAARGIAADGGTLRLKIVADFDLPGALEMGLATEAVRWSEEGEAAALASSGVGVAPLPDNVWTRGKCGLKIVQYMAAGLPVIASPVGMQLSIVEEGRTGLLARRPEEWVAALRRLHADRELRRRLGAAGREKAAAQYSVAATFPKMLGALEGLTER